MFKKLNYHWGEISGFYALIVFIALIKIIQYLNHFDLHTESIISYIFALDLMQ